MYIQYNEYLFMPTGRSLRVKTQSTKRQHILEAAIRVFAERGFHRTTIHDVAAEAGVADGTIYGVFENKMALLLGILDARPGSASPDAAPPIAADAETMIRAMVHRQWDAFSPQTLAMLRILLSEVLVDPELRRLYRERVIAPALELPEPAFEDLVKAGELVASDVPMTIRMMTATFFGLVMLRLIGDDRLEADAAQVPDLLATLLLEGMRPRAVGTVDDPL